LRLLGYHRLVLKRKKTVKLKKGILIVLEGIDGTGKTTQAELLADALREEAYTVSRFHEPSQSPWGREIRKKAVSENALTPEEELELFQKDRRDNVKRNIRPALERREVVVLDRYYFSTIAYQGSKGIDPERILRANLEFVVLPDLVFILDLDPKAGLKRTEDRKTRDLLFEREDYLNLVRGLFQRFEGDNIVHLDAGISIDRIHHQIREKALGYLKNWVISGVSIPPSSGP